VRAAHAPGAAVNLMEHRYQVLVGSQRHQVSLL